MPAWAAGSSSSRDLIRFSREKSDCRATCRARRLQVTGIKLAGPDGNARVGRIGKLTKIKRTRDRAGEVFPAISGEENQRNETYQLGNDI